MSEFFKKMRVIMWKLLIYSFVISIIIVSVASSLHKFGGWFFTEPGLVAEIVLTGIILLLVPSGDYYFKFPDGTDIVLNIIIYAVVIFVIFKIWRTRKHFSID